MKTVKAFLVALALVGAVALPGCCKKKCDKGSKSSNYKKEGKKSKSCKACKKCNNSPCACDCK